MRLAIVLLLIVAVEVRRCVDANKPVTNEDIRDAILSVVHMIRSTEDKLERHEYRERALGDQIKKALTTIDKRQKLLDPVKGTLSRLDERLAAVETILMQKDERERIQLEKTNELVVQVQQNLPKMFDKLKSELTTSVPKDETKHSSDKAILENLKKDIESKIDSMSQNIREDNKNGTQLCAHVSKNLDDVKQLITNTQKDKQDSQSAVLQELQKQKALADQILTNIKTISTKVPKVAEVSDVQAAKNEALKVIEENIAKLHKTIEGLDATKMKNDLQQKILQVLELQKTNIEQIVSNLKTLTKAAQGKGDEPAVNIGAQNETLKGLQQILKDLLRQITQIEKKIEDVRKTTEQNTAKLQKNIESADKSKNDLQPKILQAIEQQKSNVDQILSNIKNITNKIPDKIAQVADVQSALKPIEQIKKEVAEQTSTIADARKSTEQSNAKLQKAIESIDAKTKNDIPLKILQAVDQQKENIDQILSNVKTITQKVPDKIADVTDIQVTNDKLLKFLDQVKKELAQQTSAVEDKVSDLQKLTEQNNITLRKVVDVAESKAECDLQQNITQALEQQKANVNQILTAIKKVPNRIADAVDVQDAKIETAKSLEEIKNAIASQISQLENKLAEIQRQADNNGADLRKTIVDASERKPADDKQSEVLKALELQKQYTDQILSNIQTVSDKIPNKVADASDVQDVKNDAIKLLEQIKNEIATRESAMDEKLNIIRKLSEQGNDKLYNTIVDSAANKTGCDGQTEILHAVEFQQTNLDQLSRKIQMLSEELLNLANVQHVDNATNEALKELSQIGKQCVVNYDSINKQMQEVQSAIEQHNANKTVDCVTSKTPDLQPAILQAVEVQNKNLEQVFSNIKALPTSAQSPNSELNKNETLQSLQKIKEELLDQGILLTNKITALHALSEKNNENLQKTIVESGEMAEQLNSNVASSFEKLSNSVRSLSKLDQIMVQTADAVLDTKRRVEYGVHQILLDVGTVIKKHSKELNSTINARFDNLELSMLQPESGALSNLTKTIANEIDQVWRQIGIMHQQMGANTDTLERIQTQTDTYINGSATTMDNMRGKVVQITSSMAEVDDNLNYLLGRLSLVTQEFNRIKSGLGDALDQIKGSFNAVQQKLNDTGPGPHRIESSEAQGVSTNSTNPPNSN